jgi:hypothetical protein
MEGGYGAPLLKTPKHPNTPKHPRSVMNIKDIFTKRVTVPCRCDCKTCTNTATLERKLANDPVYMSRFKQLCEECTIGILFSDHATN